MATFEAQVEGLTSLSIDGSSAPTQTELTQFLTDGAKEILNALPRSKQILYTTSNELNSSSVNYTVLGSVIFSVTRDDGTINQPCRAILPELNGRVRDSDDMNAASATDPAYYILNNILSVIPEPSNSNNAHVQTLAYPAVAYGDSTIAKFPDEAEHLVPLYGAIKSLQNVLGSSSLSLNNSDNISTALSACNTELDKIVTDVSAPVAPAVSNFTTPTISAITIGGFGTAPAYTAPTVGGATEELTAALTALSSNEPGTDADFLDFSKWFTVVGEYIEDSEDIELAGVQLQKISAYISAYQSALQNQLNVFNDANVEYQATIQKQIEQSRLDSQDAQQEASLKLQKEVQEYQNKLQKYSNEIQSYQGQVSELIQNAQGYLSEVQASLSVENSKYAWYEKQQAKLQADYDKGLQILIS